MDHGRRYTRCYFVWGGCISSRACTWLTRICLSPICVLVTLCFIIPCVVLCCLPNNSELGFECLFFLPASDGVVRLQHLPCIFTWMGYYLCFRLWYTAGGKVSYVGSFVQAENDGRRGRIRLCHDLRPTVRRFAMVIH
ncbi:hypothetical protein BJX96DRAFT_155775 [Aspergillus floccosus]